MQKKLLLGAVLGGLVLFVWGFVSHALLGWYDPHLRSFTNQTEVEEAVVSGVSGSGIYLLPNLTPAEQSLPKAERAAAEAAVMERMQRGPMLFAVVRVGPGASFPTLLIVQFLIGLLAAAVATWLLLQTRIPGYGGRIAFVTAIGLVLVLWAKLPNWLWWSFPTGFTLVESLDALIGFALLGALLGRLVRPESA